MKFLIDAQLPPALAHWLREAGHEAAHVEDIGLLEAGDSTIWTHALRHGSIIVTKDEDFAARSPRSADPPVIVWLRVGNTTNRLLRAWIDLRLSRIVDLITQGHKLVEVF